MIAPLSLDHNGKFYARLVFCFLLFSCLTSFHSKAQGDCFLPPPLCSPADICAGENLFCYGDFEIFIPRSPFINGQPPTYNMDIPTCPDIQVTPDVVYDQIADNRALGFTSDETVIIPLSTAVEPGCTININYRYAKSTDNALPYTTTVNFFGTSESFCDFTTLPTCPGINCIQSVTTSEGKSGVLDLIPCNGIPNTNIDCNCHPLLMNIHVMEWTAITVPPFVNNTSEPINFIQLRTTDLYTYHVIDDLVITADCNNALELSAEVTPDCINDGSISISVANGSGNYSYDWTPSNLPDLSSHSDLSAGDYTVTVTDNTGVLCSSEMMINVPQDPSCTTDVCDVFMIAAMCGWQPFDAYQPCDPCSPNVTHLVMLIQETGGPISMRSDIS